MDIKKIYEAFTDEEKKLMMFYLTEENVKSENCLLYNWLVLNKQNMSVRLFNCLNYQFIYRKLNKDQLLLSQLTKDVFCKIRNAGEKSWKEFVELRGY